MIEADLRQIAALLSTSPAGRDVEIVRRSIRDTALKKVLHDPDRVLLADGGLIELTGRILAIQGINSSPTRFSIVI
jgi:hypothetical protein